MEKLPDRTLELNLLVFFYLVVAGAGLQRLVSAIQEYSFLEKLLPFSPLYLIFSGLLWFLAGLTSACWLWFAFKYTSWVTGVSTLLGVLSYWMERLFLYRNDPAQANLPFAAISTVCAILFVILVMCLPSQRMRYFNRR